MQSRVTGEKVKPALRGDVVGKDAVMCRPRHHFVLAEYEMIATVTTWNTKVEIHLFKDGSGYSEVLRLGNKGWERIEHVKWNKEQGGEHVASAVNA
jgi:hypothetical protein